MAAIEKNQKLLTIAKNFEEIQKSINDPYLQKNIKLLKSNLTESNDNQLFHQFEETNYDFLNKLKTLHPTLSPNDIRFLLYIYMNLSTKEIAYTLNITFDSCRKRKERIINKLGLPHNLDLYDYITGL